MTKEIPAFDVTALFEKQPQPEHEWTTIEAHGIRGKVCVRGLTAGELFEVDAGNRNATIVQMMMTVCDGPPPGGKPIFGEWQNVERYEYTKRAVPAGVASRLVAISNRLSGFGEAGNDIRENEEDSTQS